MIKLTNILKEIQIRKPIKIRPISNKTGFIDFEKYSVEYNNYGDYVDIDLMSDYSLFEKYNPNFIGEGDYYPTEESKKACDEYISFFKQNFGKNTEIRLDGYDCSFIYVPLEDFKKRISNEIVKSLGNDIFEYKEHKLFFKELTPEELKDQRKKFIEAIHIAHPHMNYDKNPEKAIKYGRLADGLKYYFILDENGNRYKSIYNPGVNKLDAIFSIPENDELKNHKLDLIKYFNIYFNLNK
jgi:hypothetical protein